MLVIAGLGNPGNQYRDTRHNVGFMVVDRLAERLKAPFVPGQGEYWFSESELRGQDVVLVKPTTYMNDSGNALADCAEKFGVQPDRILVVFDDFQIPLGTLRLRTSGSDGGHNGLGSIIYQFQTERIPRLRCGIGREAVPGGHEAIVDFVLTPFEKQELPVVEQMIDRACDACAAVAADGINIAMNKFNTPPPSEG